MDIRETKNETFKGRPRFISYPSPPDRYFIEKLKKPKNVHLKCEGPSTDVFGVSSDSKK